MRGDHAPACAHPEMNGNQEAAAAAAGGLHPLPYLEPRREYERRVTDPKTGGMKNTKPVRPDLIPEGFLRAARSVAPCQFLIPRLRTLLRNLWEGDFSDALGLPDAAAELQQAMGGEVAARKHLAVLYGVGADKYGPDNWRKGYAWSLSYAAALRHLALIEQGEMMDEQMGVPHWACVWFHCAALWTFATQGLGTDDRPKGGTA